MPNYPKDRKGKTEPLTHYLERLKSARHTYYQEKATKDKFGSFLHEYEWNWFGTFSFRKSVSSQTASRLFDDYLNTCPRCYSFFALEKSTGPMDQFQEGRVHIHALIGNASDLKMKDDWMHGWFDVKPYDSEKAAVWYVTKSKDLEWDWFGSRKIQRVPVPE
jgi:hypothetical protein